MLTILRLVQKRLIEDFIILRSFAGVVEEC